VQIQQYHVHSLQSSAKTNKNPYDVSLSARLHGPGGAELTVPGFYDGDDTWIVRFSPTHLGEWTFETISDLSGLDGQRVRDLQCVPNTHPHIHGQLRVDPKHPHHFIYEDGTRYLPLGDECDWLFALDLPVARRYLERLQAHGFTQVLMQVYAHACSWSEGQPHRLVPPPRYPWLGDNQRPQHAQMNPPFWQHLDALIAAMQSLGIVAHLMIQVHSKQVNWPPLGSADDDRYWRYVLARYQAYGNVIWDLSKEAWKVADPGYWEGRGALVRRLDAYNHLLTAHDIALEAGDLLADQHHESFHAHILHQRAKRAWPVMNVEYGYEPGPIPTYPMITLPDEMRCRTWEILTAGGYPVFYYADTAWDVFELSTQPEGYQAFQIARQVMEELPFWEMEPHDHLVDRGYCLAKPGAAYLIYLPEGGRVLLDAPEAPHDARPRATWINPRTGQHLLAGPIRSGLNSFCAPLCFGPGDALLVIR